MLQTLDTKDVQVDPKSFVQNIKLIFECRKERYALKIFTNTNNKNNF